MNAMHPKYCIHILNHDYDPDSVLESLIGQIQNRSTDIQLILWDDFSSPKYRSMVAAHQSKYRFSFIKWRMEAENVGRSVMRQKILNFQQSGWVVCLDSDMVPDDDFVDQMLASLHDHSTVYLGKHYYQSEKPIKRFILHWTYGRNREQRTWNHDHYLHFSTGIFAVHSSVAARLCFDPDMTGYGHEDTMFGMQLRELGIRVDRIDLRAQHQGLVEQHVFIDRQLQAVRNLQRVVVRYPRYRNRLIIWADYIRKIPFLASLVSSSLVRNLCLRRLDRNPENLFFLDLLKLNAWL